MEYEIIKFTNNDLKIDVNVSPSENTVWLSKEQMSILFQRNRSVISRHIKNIYDEGELEKKSTCAKNAHIPQTRNRSYESELYNLDVVISVGYRVKSQNGVVFRKWATSVLRDYLMKGYLIDDGRTTITVDNYLNLVNKVDTLDSRLTKLEDKERHLFIEDKLIFDGKIFDALSLMSKVIETASRSVILIDPYVDIRTLEFFKRKDRFINLCIITSTKAKINQIDIKAFKEESGDINIKYDNRYHDRYLIIDDESFYHLGSSINYLGKRLSQISKIVDEDIINILRQRVESI